MAKKKGSKKQPVEKDGSKPDIHELLKQMAAGKKLTRSEFDDWLTEYEEWTNKQMELSKIKMEETKIIIERANARLKEIDEFLKGEAWKKNVKKIKPSLAFNCDTGNFKIGTPVVAIADHSDGTFKIGEVFLLRGMKMGCRCKPLLLDIGLEGFYTACNDCGVSSFNGPWMGADKFKPFETKSDYTIDSLLDELIQ